ncbi:MAG: hypothetical protein HQM12_19835 [SAR324 cluster bacterium]|nr:hypothetical protein [SAR324 cluster bacterium]
MERLDMHWMKFFLPNQHLGPLSRRFGKREIQRLIACEQLDLEQESALPAARKKQVIEALEQPFRANPPEWWLFMLERRLYRRRTTRYVCLAGLLEKQPEAVSTALLATYYENGLPVSWSLLYRMTALLEYTNAQKRILNSLSTYQSGTRDLGFTVKDYERLFEAALDVKIEQGIRMLTQATLLGDQDKRAFLFKYLTAHDLLRLLHLPWFTPDDRYEIAVNAFIPPEVSALKTRDELEQEWKTELKGSTAGNLKQELEKKMLDVTLPTITRNAFDAGGGIQVLRHLFDIHVAPVITEDNDLVERRIAGEFITTQALIPDKLDSPLLADMPLAVVDSALEQCSHAWTHALDTHLRCPESLTRLLAEDYPHENFSDLVYYIVGFVPGTYPLLREKLQEKSKEYDNLAGLTSKTPEEQQALHKQRTWQRILLRIMGTAFLHAFLLEKKPFVRLTRITGKGLLDGDVITIATEFREDVNRIPLALLRSALWSYSGASADSSRPRAGDDAPCPEGVVPEEWFVWNERRRYPVNDILLLLLNHAEIPLEEKIHVITAAIERFFPEISRSLLATVLALCPQWLVEPTVSRDAWMRLFSTLYRQDFDLVNQAFEASRYQEKELRWLFKQLFLVEDPQANMHWFEFFGGHFHAVPPQVVPDRQAILDETVRERDRTVDAILAEQPAPARILSLMVHGHEYNQNVARFNTWNEKMVRDDEQRFQQFLKTAPVRFTRDWLPGTWAEMVRVLSQYSQDYRTLTQSRTWLKRNPEYFAMVQELTRLQRRVACWLKIPNPTPRLHHAALLMSHALQERLGKGIDMSLFADIELPVVQLRFYQARIREILGFSEGSRLLLILAGNTLRTVSFPWEWLEVMLLIIREILTDDPDQTIAWLQEHGHAVLAMLPKLQPLYLFGLTRIEFGNAILRDLERRETLAQDEIPRLIEGIRRLSQDLRAIRWHLNPEPLSKTTELFKNPALVRLTLDLFHNIPVLSLDQQAEIEALGHFMSTLPNNRLLQRIMDFNRLIGSLMRAHALRDRVKDAPNWSPEQAEGFMRQHLALLAPVRDLMSHWHRLDAMRIRGELLQRLPSGPSDRFNFIRRFLGGQKLVRIQEELKQLPELRNQLPQRIHAEVDRHAERQTLSVVQVLAWRDLLPHDKTTRFIQLYHQLQQALKDANSGEETQLGFETASGKSLGFDHPLLKQARALIAEIADELKHQRRLFDLIRKLLSQPVNLPMVLKLLEMIEALTEFSLTTPEANAIHGLLAGIRQHELGYTLMRTDSWNKLTARFQQIQEYQTRINGLLQRFQAPAREPLELLRDTLKHRLSLPDADKPTVGRQMAAIKSLEKLLKKQRIEDARREVEQGTLQVLRSELTPDFWNSVSNTLPAVPAQLKLLNTRKTQANQQLALIRSQYFLPEPALLFQQRIFPRLYDLLLKKLAESFLYNRPLAFGDQNPLLAVNSQYLPELLKYLRRVRLTDVKSAPFQLAGAVLRHFFEHYRKDTLEWRRSLKRDMLKFKDNLRITQAIEAALTQAVLWFEQPPVQTFRDVCEIRDRDIRHRFLRFFIHTTRFLTTLRQQVPEIAERIAEDLRWAHLDAPLSRHKKMFDYQGQLYLDRLEHEMERQNRRWRDHSLLNPSLRLELEELRLELERLQLLAQNRNQHKQLEVEIGLLPDRTGHDLFSGNATGCCIAVNGLFAQVPFQYHADNGCRILAIYEPDISAPAAVQAGKKNILSAAWLWLARDPITHEPGLVIDGIETQPRLAYFQDSFLKAYLSWLRMFCEQTGLRFVYLRENYNDVPTARLPRKPQAFEKLGEGLLANDYYYPLKNRKNEQVYDLSGWCVIRAVQPARSNLLIVLRRLWHRIRRLPR